MDRDHVGLYGSGWTAAVPPGLYAGHGYRESRGKLPRCFNCSTLKFEISNVLLVIEGHANFHSARSLCVCFEMPLKAHVR